VVSDQLLLQVLSALPPHEQSMALPVLGSTLLHDFLNWPSRIKNILIAIPAKAIPMSIVATKMSLSISVLVYP